MDIEALRKIILKLQKIDVVQCDYFPAFNSVQIVFKLPQSRIRQIAGYKDAEWRIRTILKTCQKQKIDCSVRVGVKIHNGATVLTCSYAKNDMLSYDDKQDIKKIATEWSKASLFL